MKTRMIIAGMCAALTFSVAQASEKRSEPVDQSALPQAVQKTIQKHAAGGEVVSVQREDDPDGKWNYEVVVKSNGKEWGFEVDPKGRFLKKRS
jgi:uncharacterized membrane protein YkoI